MKHAPGIFICLLSLWFSTAVASAQPVLERLEQRIRERVKPLVTGAVPADRGAAQRPLPPAGRPAAAGLPVNFEPGYLGVVADDQKDRGRGVRVLDLRPGGPAEKAGILRNDLINGIAGIRVRQMTDMADIMILFSPGDILTFDVLRGNKQQQVKVTLGRRPAPKGRPEAVPPPAGTAAAPNVPSASVPLLNTPQLNTPQATATPATPAAKSPANTLAGTLAKMLGKTGDKTPGKTPGKTTGKTPVIETPAVKLPVVVKPPVKPVVPPAVGDAETIKRLEQRIKELENHVAELEKALAEAKQKK